MKRHRNALRIFLGCALAAVIACTAFSGAAGASPAWYFEGEELEGKESTLNGPPLNYFVIPGLATGCEMFPLGMNIANVAKKGEGEVVELSPGSCSTNSPLCTVESFGAESLPWPASLLAKSGSNYLIIKGIRLQVLYGGEECVLNEVLAEINGSAGGRVENSTESIMFSGINSKVTGTKLTALGETVEWYGALTLKATGPHQAQALTVQ